ncbi:acyl-CoA dehydrogenase family protein [Maritalea porphyrae]|uniref:acyl-CoA dehydrogenase family protein n=1 Tax=Maritalea porphyrae TaxID=880732 RepID=UPI0022AF4075|nr:acyl-CoA dehydrogenase family protein [Maritalea porphyrae]MCZ4272070.1 acyl-CoA dehydrogenase family protein [Maritalea porphyrae]
MDFALSEEQSAIFEMAREFSMENIAPNAVEWDQAKHFPLDVIKKTAELGMAGIYTRDDIGGSDLTRLDAALIFEALSHGCPATASFLSIHNMCSWMIDTFGSEDMRQKWGPKLTSMETVASYCLTEPGSGSDAASLKTTAKRDGDTYVLKGTKSFISGGGVSDLYIVMARTGEPGPKGISAFLMEKGTPGLSYGANEKKMGWNVQPTTEVVMDDVVIPAANLLGKEGDGFKYAMKGLDGGRLNIAASALGAAQAALDKTLSYMSERQAFGKSINQFQALQFRLADMEIELQAARVFLYKAAWTYDQGTPDATKYCAMAKRFVTDTAFDVANQALQLHGGYGYLADYGIEKIVRDLRVHQILEGTNEIMRLIVSRQLLSE